MRRALCILFSLSACGGDNPVMPDAAMAATDAPAQQCLPQGAVGSFYRRQGNPRLVAGSHVFTDDDPDLSVLDPDLRTDGSTWHVYYATAHGTYGSPGTPLIRHATSSNLATWTPTDSPSLALPADGAAWDAVTIDSPSVVENPDAPADRRYLMLYTGSRAALDATFRPSSIGAAFSADGVTFTRVSASDSPKGSAGLVLTGGDAYPGAADAFVADPEVVLVGGTYHLWFSSKACSGSSCATVDAYGIGHATSTDGIHWTLDAAPVPSLLRASADLKTGGGQPTVIYDDVHCRWEMWLANDSPATENDNQPTEAGNMVGVWHATSTNATSWTINYAQLRDLVWDGNGAGEHLGIRAGADVARKDTGRYMIYTGFDDQNVPSGSTLATRTGSTSGVMTLNLATRDAPP